MKELKEEYKALINMIIDKSNLAEKTGEHEKHLFLLGCIAEMLLDRIEKESVSKREL